MRTVPEKTLRNWNAGAGTGPGRTQAKRSNTFNQKITVDAVQGSGTSSLHSCAVMEGSTGIYEKGESSHENIAGRKRNRVLIKQSMEK